MKRGISQHIILFMAMFVFFCHSNGICKSCNSLSLPNITGLNGNNLCSLSNMQPKPFSTIGWSRTYGTSTGEGALSIQQTADGGYIVAGYTASADAWILKLDSNGGIIWQKTYGSIDEDAIYSIQQTSDGGYIAAGFTTSPGELSALVLKLDANGTIAWQKAFSGYEVRAYSIEQTSDGGYIVAGLNESNASNFWDFLLLKLDASGSVVWQYSYGSPDEDEAYSVQQTTDGGYIVAGTSYDSSSGYFDYLLLKLDMNGGIIWQKKYGSIGYCEPDSIQQTSDGGYIVAGFTTSFGAGSSDAWILKLDSNGEIVWQNTYGGSSNDRAYSIQQTSDGGYIVAGYTTSFGAGSSDAWILKLDSNGGIIWQKTYGGIGDDAVYSIKQTSDGGYIAAGYTSSFGAGGSNFWILKLDSNGEIGTSCTIAGNTNISPSATYIIPSTSTASAHNLFISSLDTDFAGRTTAIFPVEQCDASNIHLEPYAGIKPDVDDSGSPTHNGIIEPDESVILRGHLQNTGTADSMNTIGFLSTIDPINIIQPNVIYGTIPASSNQSCTTCYSLIAPSANRPETHWDFHVIEQASADQYGPVSFEYTYHVGKSFSDVPTSYIFYSYIEKILHLGATSGCAASLFCPDGHVERQHMAKFICMSMQTSYPGACTPNCCCSGIFDDYIDYANPLCPYVEALYNLGIVTGCQTSPHLYCPNDAVQRQTMAKFVCKGMESANPGSCISTGCSGIFSDVPPSNIFCPYIEALYNANIIAGCDTNLFCPDSFVTRGQMAKFLVKAFNLAL